MAVKQMVFTRARAALAGAALAALAVSAGGLAAEPAPPVTLGEELSEFINPANWRWGLGVAAVDYPAYPGAEQRDLLVSPIPWAEYHGERLSVGRDGFAATLGESKFARLDLSVSGSLPVDNARGSLREGMPDLELMVEVGPSLELAVWSGRQQALELHLPVRKVLSVASASSIHAEGYVFDPRLHYSRSGQLGSAALEWEIDLGALYGDRDYTQLFYEVAPEHASAARPAYSAKSGLVGLRGSSTLTVDAGPWLLMGYLRLFDLGSSDNRASPLLAKTNYALVGAAVVYRFDGLFSASQ